MLSIFVLRIFDFEHNFTQAQISSENEHRKENFDSQSEKEANSTIQKSTLVKNPVNCSFEYSQNNCGYWNFNTIVL